MIDIVAQSQSRRVFDAEAQYLAPGTQSVALFSKLCMDRGEGAILWDVDGNRYVDLLAGVGVASLGYAHPRYVAEMTKQLERVQGAAGNVVPPAGYLKELRALATEIGALLICDEMITGFGRTGKMFAIEHDAIVPDVLLVGKGFGGGFPVSGIVIREQIAFSKPWANPSGSSSSYGGNPLAAAAAHVTIQTIVDEELVEHSRRLGALMLAEMQRWEDEIPIVSDVRGRGLMLGMDLVVPGTRKLLDKKITRWIFDTLLARGVIAMIYNPEVRINPPLVITDEQAMEALATIKAVLEEAVSRVRE